MYLPVFRDTDNDMKRPTPLRSALAVAALILSTAFCGAATPDRMTGGAWKDLISKRAEARKF